MTLLRILLAALVLAGPKTGVAMQPAGPPPDSGCRAIVGGTGGAHFIRDHCPERDRQVAEAVRARLEETQRSVETVMNRIESLAVLPADAAPLADYDRYYAWDDDAADRRRVIGVYTRFRAPTGGRHWIAKSDLPVILDGGCGIVTLVYDAEADRIESVACNELG